MDFEDLNELEQQKKLMKKSKFLLISFFMFLILDIALFIYLQKNQLFMFNLSKNDEMIPNSLITDIFSFFFYTIILISVIIFIILLIVTFKKVYNSNPSSYKKVINAADIFNIVPIFLFVAIVVNGFFFSLAQVDGESMVPTFCDKDTVIIYYNNDFIEEDIIIVKWDNHFIIKRIVGLPGDELLVDETGVYINNVLIETYLPAGFQEYDGIIPEGYYYVLGDNREHSLDSRVINLIPQENILGEVIYNLTNGNCE
ncbi:MAG TPA: signal peptidase I [Bacillota bacterium]|nr:signal peptidase I [Bacillota bacterium]